MQANAYKASCVPIRFGNRSPDPMVFNTFQEYLDKVGIEHFTESEVTKIGSPNVAKKHNIQTLLPPRDMWVHGAAILSIADVIRKLVGNPVLVKSWYRPEPYNKEVGGASKSDHVYALAMDLRYKAGDHRRKAEKYLEALKKTDPWLRLSTGYGNKTTHIGILTDIGQRSWYYDSYKP